MANVEHIEGRRDLAWALGICLVAVIIVRSFLFEPFKIPSSSMVPTLRIGDHIFVSKFSYGLSLPFTTFEFLKTGEPKRGDVIVFLYPRDPSLHYIKRVVGIPGDRVEFKGNDLYINGDLVKKEKITDPAIIEEVTGSRDLVGDLYKETIDGVTHFVKYMHNASSDIQRTTPVEVIEKDQYFVVGDNRDDSYDSRSWGPVERKAIKGKAQIIWLSLEQEQNFGAASKLVRWDRCGTIIH